MRVSFAILCDLSVMLFFPKEVDLSQFECSFVFNTEVETLQCWKTSADRTLFLFVQIYFCPSVWLHLMFVSRTDWRGIRPGAVIQTNTWSCNSKLSISPPSLHITLVPTFLSIWHLTALVKLHARENDVKPSVYGAYLITPSYSEDSKLLLICAEGDLLISRQKQTWGIKSNLFS